MKTRIRFALIASLLSLAGCASLTYEPVLLDSAVPLGADGKPLTKSPVCSIQLEPGRTCVALVRAENWYSDTGLRVKPGESYCVRIPEGQMWFDASRRNTPPKGEAGSTAMNLFKELKRHDLPWFTLMAGVVSFQKPEIQPSLEIRSLPLLQSVNLAEQKRIDINRDIKDPGALVMYPNDARYEYFYKNNSGQIWVQISHLRASEPCTDMLVP